MAERMPPGRAGRLWLRRRLAVARRSRELLDRKRQLLRRELERTNEQREGSARAWRQASAEAGRWALRAALGTGLARMELLGAPLAGVAKVDVGWRDTMGVRFPQGVRCTLPELRPADAAAASAAVAPAAAALRGALEAAARYAVDGRAADLIEAELARTEHQLRAIERRRLPELEETLRLLEIRLDELEREERVVARWAQHRRAPR